MQKSGIIYSVDLDNKTISLQETKKITYYYISNSLMKKFKKYLYKGNLVSFVYDNTLKVKGKYSVYQIEYFKEISVPGRFGKDVLYSKKDTSLLLMDFLDNLDNLLFIDIEMSMPGYKDKKNFTSEIIQAGFFVVNKNEEILEKYNFHIKTSINKYLSDRTTDFLNITFKELEKTGVDYLAFYEKFKSLIVEYNPAVVVFGKNDKMFLESSYYNNKVQSLTDKTRFVNLNQLIKNFYDLNQDPGLFKMYERLYHKSLSQQSHDALEDAYVTYDVYRAFYNDVHEYATKIVTK